MSARPRLMRAERARKEAQLAALVALAERMQRRKIVQLAPAVRGEDVSIYAACDDGSLWFGQWAPRPGMPKLTWRQIAAPGENRKE